MLDVRGLPAASAFFFGGEGSETQRRHKEACKPAWHAAADEFSVAFTKAMNHVRGKLSAKKRLPLSFQLEVVGF